MRLKSSVRIQNARVRTPILLIHVQLIAKIAFSSPNIAIFVLGECQTTCEIFSTKLQLTKCCVLTSILRTSRFFTRLR